MNHARDFLPHADLIEPFLLGAFSAPVVFGALCVATGYALRKSGRTRTPR